MRVAIGNKEAAFPAPPPPSRGSLWGEMIVLSSATASPWAPAQHVIAGAPRGPAASFLPGTGSWGEESAELCPWNHEWHSKLSACPSCQVRPVGPAVYSGLHLPCCLFFLNFCWTHVSSFPTGDKWTIHMCVLLDLLHTMFQKYLY